MLAPRFESLMYHVYGTESDSEALVGFPDSFTDKIFPFRDRLTDLLGENTDCFMVKNEDEPCPGVDSCFRAYRSENKEQILKFSKRQPPGFLHQLFSTSVWRSYLSERDVIDNLILYELETSHDHPCLIVESYVHQPDLLAEVIERVSNELDLTIQRNHDLMPFNRIICSNKVFS